MKAVTLVAAALLAASCGASHQPSGTGSDVVAAGAAHSPDVGEPAIDGTVMRASGTPIALAETWRGHSETVLVFYRGFF